MERGYNGKMIRKQILKAQEYSRKDVLEREKGETSEPKLRFNITYYSVFQNIKHKKVFPNVPVVDFRNGKSLKD